MCCVAICSCAAVLVLAGGCGDSSTTTATLADHDFLARAEAICSRVSQKQFDSVRRALASSNGKRSLEEITGDVILPAASKMISELSSLQPPTEMESQVDLMIKRLNEGLERSRSRPKSFLSGGAFSKADQTATELGLTKCKI
jgi:hypothetical protein